MFKQTLLAMATVVGLIGFGGMVESTPAAAQVVQHRIHRPAAAPQHRVWTHEPRQRWHNPPRRDWHRRDHWRRDRWHRDRWYGGVYVVPGAPYAYEDCRLVKRRVRVLTDDGWRLRWRWRRVCD